MWCDISWRHGQYERRKRIILKSWDMAEDGMKNTKWARNVKLLRRVGEERSTLKSIKKRKVLWIGHTVDRDYTMRKEWKTKIWNVGWCEERNKVLGDEDQHSG